MSARLGSRGTRVAAAAVVALVAVAWVALRTPSDDTQLPHLASTEY